MAGLSNAYLIRPPRIYRWLFKEALFRKAKDKPIVYLTFDDGPDPEVTPFVLDVLRQNGVKATFFVLGKNVINHPELLEQLRSEGHSVANHGMEHLNGWSSSTKEYAANAEEGKRVSGSDLFRPPYGKMTYSQYRTIKNGSKLVFWDVISGDFDQKLKPEEVKRNVLEHVRNGSIIVMHDSLKAMNNLMGSLNETIIELRKKGFKFEVLRSPEDA